MISHSFIGHHYDIICGKRLVLPKQSPNALLLYLSFMEVVLGNHM